MRTPLIAAVPRAVSLPLALAAALAPACSAPAPTQRPVPPRPAPAASLGQTEESVPPAPAPEPRAADAAPQAADEPDAPPAEAVLASVAGVPITAREYTTWLLHRNPTVVQDELHKMVGARLAVAEAQRLSLRLDPDRVDERMREARVDFEERVGKLELGLSMEAFVARHWNLDPQRFVTLMREDVIRQMIVERMIRAWVLASERVVARAIVVEDDEALAEVQRRLAAGEDFAAVARELSVDRSAAEGGFLPYVMRTEGSPLSRLAFQAAVGEVVGPAAWRGATFLLRVEEVPTPVVGDWTQIAEAVEESLAERPVRDSEYLDWRLAMERRYEVDLLPFLEFVGEPIPSGAPSK